MAVFSVKPIAARDVSVDKFDRQILALLRSDARTSVSQIAREVNLSRSAVSERIRYLESSGVIRGYHAHVAEPGEAGVKAFLELFYQGRRCEEYVERLRALPEVRHCSGISGETDMLVFIEAPSMLRLSEVRGAIEAFPGMQKVKTHVVVKDWAM
jgi:Lrp/AsnC family leucine-responsive transcriptional regulator